MQIDSENTTDPSDVPLSFRSKSTFGGDVLKIASGTTFAQALIVLASPFLTRLYSPESFGALALFTSITSIIVVISCMRYELSIMLPESDKDAANLLGVSLLFVALLSVLTIPVIWWGRGLLVAWLNAPELMPYLWLVPPAVFIGGTFLALNYWNSRTKHFGRLSLARATSSVATVSTQLGAGFAGYASGGSLIGANVVGQAVGVAFLGGQIWRDDRKLLLWAISWRDMLTGIKRHRKFPLIDTWGALLNSASWQLPAFLLAIFFSQKIVGYYAITFRLISMPMSLLGGALGQVFFQRASEFRHKPDKLAENISMVFKKLVSICLFPALLLSVAGREFFTAILGHGWSEAGVYAQILSIWMFCWFISSPLSAIFVTLERQGLALVVHVVIFSSRIISLVLGGLLRNVYLAMGLFAVSGVLVYGALALWSLKLAGVSPKSSLLMLLRYIGYSFFPIAFIVMLNVYKINPVWVTIIAAMELIAYYLIIIRTDPQIYRRFYSVFTLFRGRL